MTDFCEKCGQTVLGGGEVEVRFPPEIAQHAEVLMAQLNRRRDVFGAIDQWLGYRLKERLDCWDDGYLPSITVLSVLPIEALNEFRLGALRRAEGKDREAVFHLNRMTELLMECAAEIVWVLADYGYPLKDNIPDLIRRREDEETLMGD